MPHFRVTVTPPAILITGAALGPDVLPTLRQARAVLTDRVAAQVTALLDDSEKKISAILAERNQAIAALREARNGAVKVRESELPSDETTIGQQMKEIGRQVEAGAKGTPDDPVFGKPHGHGTDPNADEEAA